LIDEAKSLLFEQLGESHAVQMLALIADYIARRSS